jgi:phytoene/squalene synthetase
MTNKFYSLQEIRKATNLADSYKDKKHNPRELKSYLDNIDKSVKTLQNHSQNAAPQLESKLEQTISKLQSVKEDARKLIEAYKVSTSNCEDKLFFFFFFICCSMSLYT